MGVQGVPEQAPGKLPKRADPHHLGRNPEDGHGKEGAGAPPSRQRRNRDTDHCGEEPKHQTEQDHHGNGHCERHPAELRHDEGRPVDEAQRRDEACELAEKETLAKRGTVQRHEQRRESEQTEDPVPELRKREDERHPARCRQSETPDRGHGRSSGAIVSA